VSESEQVERPEAGGEPVPRDEPIDYTKPELGEPPEHLVPERLLDEKPVPEAVG
jgi:hypothetical protein